MTNGNARPGLASFSLDEEDEITVPTPQQRAAAREGGERLGFKSEPAESPARQAPAPARSAVYTANFHIRTTPEDRDRYDEFAYRNRMKKGEAMRLLLDLAEEAETARARQRGD